MKATHVTSFILVVIGALNWGIVGLGYWFGAGWSWNVVNMILGSWPGVESVVYVLVGLAGLVLLFTHKKDCKGCQAPAQAM
jgi:uncharacterized membrane protein YuzA (DUF378 family)